jgi:hypothetical protein
VRAQLNAETAKATKLEEELAAVRAQLDDSRVQLVSYCFVWGVWVYVCVCVPPYAVRSW